MSARTILGPTIAAMPATMMTAGVVLVEVVITTVDIVTETMIVVETTTVVDVTLTVVVLTVVLTEVVTVVVLNVVAIAVVLNVAPTAAVVAIVQGMMTGGTDIFTPFPAMYIAFIGSFVHVVALILRRIILITLRIKTQLKFGTCRAMLTDNTHDTSLPQELVDLIVDFIEEEPLSLRACALAGHCFLQRCRMHLFHTVRFTDDTSSGRFLPLLLSPQIPPLVKEILVVGSGTTTKSQWIASDDILSPILDSFVNVEAVGILSCRFDSVTTIQKLRTLSTKAVNMLRLDMLQFERTGDFFSLLQCFPSLRHLLLGSVYVRFNERHPVSHSQPVLLETLEVPFHLSLTSVPTVGLLLDPQSPITLRHLKSLRIARLSLNDLPIIRSLVEASRAMLVDLFLGPIRMVSVSELGTT